MIIATRKQEERSNKEETRNKEQSKQRNKKQQGRKPTTKDMIGFILYIYNQQNAQSRTSYKKRKEDIRIMKQKLEQGLLRQKFVQTNDDDIKV